MYASVSISELAAIDVEDIFIGKTSVLMNPRCQYCQTALCKGSIAKKVVFINERMIWIDSRSRHCETILCIRDGADFSLVTFSHFIVLELTLNCPVRYDTVFRAPKVHQNARLTEE